MGKYLDEYSKALEDIQTNGTTVVNMDYLMALNLKIKTSYFCKNILN